jgi:hypothetical protein
VSAAIRLAALAEEEHRLVTEGHWDDLAALHERREALMAELGPPRPLSAADRAALERAVGIQGLVTVALRRGTAELVGQVRDVGLGRRAVQAYGMSTSV